METGSRGALWSGRIISGLIVLFMIMDGVMKLVKPAPVTQAMAQLGFPEGETAGIGIVALVCAALYVIPRTSVLGAILLTAFLGGATAAKVRTGVDPFSLFFAPTLGILAWLGLWLRSPQLRALIPLRAAKAASQASTPPIDAPQRPVSAS